MGECSKQSTHFNPPFHSYVRHIDIAVLFAFVLARSHTLSLSFWTLQFDLSKFEFFCQYKNTLNKTKQNIGSVHFGSDYRN